MKVVRLRFYRSPNMYIEFTLVSSHTSRFALKVTVIESYCFVELALKEAAYIHLGEAKMSDDIRKRFDFPNSLIQSQAVGHLIAAVLKEHGGSEKIHQTTNQTAALNLLWEKCCSDNVVVRTACCEGLVALVAQGHAEFSYVLNGILNLIPSTRNMPGLIKALMKLLQIQALKEGQSGEKDIRDIYTISCYISNFISDFINLDALSLPFEKVPWGAEKKQKDGPCFRIHSVNLCLFIGFLYLDGYFLTYVGKVFFKDFVEYVFCAFELVFFSFFYPYYSKFRPFHGVPDFLDILCYNLFGFGVFLDC
ncbi:hypothetical protein STEG23_026682 [Scotinomys teguina]